MADEKSEKIASEKMTDAKVKKMSEDSTDEDLKKFGISDERH